MRRHPLTTAIIQALYLQPESSCRKDSALQQRIKEEEQKTISYPYYVFKDIKK